MVDESISIHGCDSISAEEFDVLKKVFGSERAVISIDSNEDLDAEKIVVKCGRDVCHIINIEGQCLILRANTEISDYFFSGFILDAYGDKQLDGASKVYVIGKIDMRLQYPVVTGSVTVAAVMAPNTRGQQTIFIKKQNELFNIYRDEGHTLDCDVAAFDQEPVLRGVPLTSLTQEEFEVLRTKIFIYGAKTARPDAGLDDPKF